MGDLISRSALLKRIDEFYDELAENHKNTPNHAEAFCMIDNLIMEQPTVEAEPVVHGAWIVEDKGLSMNANTWQVQRAFLYKCNLCNYHTGNQGKYFKYCPNCGAKMDGGV